MAIKFDTILGKVRKSDVGTGSGDMLKATYDPTNIASSAFARANHTGTQTASTISDFDTEVSNNTDVAANTSARHAAVTVTDSTEIDFTLTGQDITASLKAGSIDETKLDTSTNASLDLADSALQPSAIGVSVQAYSAVLAGTTASFTTADETKLDGIEALAEVNNISDVNATDLTDGGATTLHKHDHGGMDGLADDDHTQYALLLGRAGGQTLIGGTAANDDLTLEGTSNATRTTSYVILQPNGGNVGIGTTSPNTSLDISGVLRVNSGTLPNYPTTGAGFEIVYDADGSAGSITGGSGVSFFTSVDRTSGTAYRDLWFNGGTLLFNSRSSGSIRFRADTGADQMVISSTGNVAIGTSTPASLLDVRSTTGGVLTLSRNDTTINANDVVGKLQFYANDTQTTTNQIVADIEVQATNTISTDINPGRMIFRTTPTGVGATPTEAMRITEAQNLQLVEACNLILGTTTGTKIGTATTQKLGFYNATPIIRPGAYTQTYSTADKTIANITIQTLTAASGTGDTTVADVGASFNQTTLNNNFKDLANQVNNAVTDITDLKQAVNALIDDLQNLGLVA